MQIMFPSLYWTHFLYSPNYCTLKQNNLFSWSKDVTVRTVYQNRTKRKGIFHDFYDRSFERGLAMTFIKRTSASLSILDHESQNYLCFSFMEQGTYKNQLNDGLLKNKYPLKMGPLCSYKTHICHPPPFAITATFCRLLSFLVTTTNL